MTHLDIKYCFRLEDGHEEIFSVQLDLEHLESRTESAGALPDWTFLTFHQCENCTLPNEPGARCPAAVNMVGIVNRLDTLLSHDETLVVITTGDRKISRTTTVQRSVCSLMGLLMATSRCPMTSFFKPMARFHLPFASTEETIWRATSTYLMAQYFKLQCGQVPDYQFEGLTDIYLNIQTVNIAFAKRLRFACHHDSMVNAITLLDMFAQSMPIAIDESLEEIRHLFAPYLAWEEAQNEKISIRERDQI